MNKNQVILHGECMVFKSDIPKNAKKMVVTQGFQIVAPSETTGNHHVVDVHPGVTMFECEGKIFMETTVDTTIRCLVKERHDSVKIPAGTYEFGSQQEFDPFTARMNAVRD
jgi:hypothetical protein